MRYLKLLLPVWACIWLCSCGSSITHDKAGMEKLDKEIKKEFGVDAWYTLIEIAGNGSDDVITVNETKDPNSLKQEQWAQSSGFWDKKAEVTLSVEGAAPKSFMFQLDKEVSLSRLGELMEQSLQKLKTEKQVDDAVVTLAQIRSSNAMNTKAEGIYYSLSLESKKARKSYNFVYKLDGTLKELNE